VAVADPEDRAGEEGLGAVPPTGAGRRAPAGSHGAKEVWGSVPPMGAGGRAPAGSHGAKEVWANWGLFPQWVQGAEPPLGVRGRRTLQKLEY